MNGNSSNINDSVGGDNANDDVRHYTVSTEKPIHRNKTFFNISKERYEEIFKKNGQSPSRLPSKTKKPIKMVEKSSLPKNLIKLK